MTKEVSFVWTLPLSPDDQGKEMQLTVSVNDPQTITSTLRKPDGSLVTGAITNESIGSDLKGKQLRCTSVVDDFDANSNETDVTFQVNQYSITYKESVDKDGDSIVYKVKIVFV